MAGGQAAERLETLAEKAFALRSKPKLDNPAHAEQSYQRWADAAESVYQLIDR
ncbi:hypothetical protein [Pseudomonas sp. SBB6]|uniref:hypothetical protein n=1 Tax=Pseudomonas sp. SBB6 TaxID=2962032 RepID=UPI0020B8DB51|nr:hypothetical protein [Pseudomonas sp. SBB6]MCP3749275.1 hypothetical protein [Pseudomonas sp. SBB6]